MKTSLYALGLTIATLYLSGCEGHSTATEGHDAPRATAVIARVNVSTHSAHLDSAHQRPQAPVVSWEALIPENDLEALLNPPAYLADIEEGSMEDQLSGQIGNAFEQQQDQDHPYFKALRSTQIKPEFDGQRIRIPGFVVPLEFDDQQNIGEFFLVPFFGACIHVPPPPPNQIIHANFAPGFQIDNLYDPVWISGVVRTELIENDVAQSAYAITIDTIEPYTDYEYQ